MLSVNDQSKEPNASLIPRDMYATSHDRLHTSFQNFKGCVGQLNQDVHCQHAYKQTSSQTRVEQYATKRVFLLTTYYRPKVIVTCLHQSHMTFNEDAWCKNASTCHRSCFFY